MARAGTSLADVTTVATHPHAEAQVRRWLHRHLPGATVTLVGSTAGAAQAVAAGEYDAAVGAAVAGELYGLSPLAHDIADNAGAVTRFVLLTRPAPPPAPTGNDRTTLVAYLREDHSGALLEILTEFAPAAVNLTRIESRPTKGRHRAVLLLDRLRGPHRRRAGRRRASRAAPGLRRRSLPRLVSAARRQAGRGSRSDGPTPISPKRATGSLPSAPPAAE